MKYFDAIEPGMEAVESYGPNYALVAGIAVLIAAAVVLVVLLLKKRSKK